MNNIGLHIGYWWGTGRENDIFDMLDLTHKANIRIMELNPAWLLKLDENDCKKLLDKVEEYSMKLTLNGGLDPTTDISSDDEAIRNNGIEYCKTVLKKMPMLNLEVWSGINYSAWLRVASPNDNIHEEKERAKAYSVQCLKEIIKVAEDVGADYCFEVCNRYEQFLFNTAKDAVEFAQRVESPRAKVHLDTYHMNIEEDNMVEAIVYAANAGKLGHLHVGESNRRIPGIGATQIDWSGFGSAVKNVNYNGAIVMEPFVLTTAHNAKRTNTWRDLSDYRDIPALISDACTGGEFLRKLVN